jgi:hypothetical protein
MTKVTFLVHVLNDLSNAVAKQLIIVVLNDILEYRIQFTEMLQDW